MITISLSAYEKDMFHFSCYINVKSAVIEDFCPVRLGDRALPIMAFEYILVMQISSTHKLNITFYTKNWFKGVETRKTI